MEDFPRNPDILRVVISINDENTQIRVEDFPRTRDGFRVDITIVKDGEHPIVTEGAKPGSHALGTPRPSAEEIPGPSEKSVKVPKEKSVRVPNMPASSSPLSKIFIVHGHDEAALQGTARFLERIRLKTIVLREEPDLGRTIINKFEDCACEVGFAVVLLTADDIAKTSINPHDVYRARQNVIFELGYFTGKLGRGRTCLLRKGEVEIPSDLYGVIYTEMDASGGWQMKLARELVAAGFKINSGKMFK